MIIYIYIYPAVAIKGKDNYVTEHGIKWRK